MMTRADAQAVVDIVAADPESNRRIDSNIDGLIPASWGVAGGVRNAGYVALYMASFGRFGDPTDVEYADRVCTGIADATSKAIDKAVQNRDARVRRVRRAGVVDRTRYGTAHTATSVMMIDGQTHVIDWHATLVLAPEIMSHFRRR
jgi:hypothetical protein